MTKAFGTVAIIDKISSPDGLVDWKHSVLQNRDPISATAELDDTVGILGNALRTN